MVTLYFSSAHPILSMSTAIMQPYVVEVEDKGSFGYSENPSCIKLI